MNSTLPTIRVRAWYRTTRRRLVILLASGAAAVGLAAGFRAELALRYFRHLDGRYAYAQGLNSVVQLKLLAPRWQAANQAARAAGADARELAYLTADTNRRRLDIAATRASDLRSDHRYEWTDAGRIIRKRKINDAWDHAEREVQRSSRDAEQFIRQVKQLIAYANRIDALTVEALKNVEDAAKRAKLPSEAQRFLDGLNTAHEATP